MFIDVPPVASWRHGNSRVGFEACSFLPSGGGWAMSGSTTAVEANEVWWVAYEIKVDASWATRDAVITAKCGTRPLRTIVIEGDGEGHWRIDGFANPQFDGCLDVDLESSAMTNALPIRRLSPAVGGSVTAAAVYVRVEGLTVERLEQRYLRVIDGDTGPAFDYEAPAFEFSARIDYDPSGLVVRYPGVADRIS
jgi:hypothetical protein